MMGKEVQRYIGRRVDLIYLDSKGQFSQRKVLLQSMQNGRIRGFDIAKNAPRIFLIENVLAVQLDKTKKPSHL